MTFYVENETDKSFSFDVEEIVRIVAEEVLNRENCPYETQINVLLTDNTGIQGFNNEYRNIDRETDVLSFPNLDFIQPSDFSIDESREADYFDPDTGELILGDIIISVEKVVEQAQNYGHSEKREFAFLMAHSMLHLCGYDHLEEDEAHTMERKQALSDIINNIKKIMAITNDTIEIKPIVVSDFLNDNMESNRGRTSINQLYT